MIVHIKLGRNFILQTYNVINYKKMLTAISIEKIMGLKIENSIKKTIEYWENWNIINPFE